MGLQGLRDDRQAAAGLADIVGTPRLTPIAASCQMTGPGSTTVAGCSRAPSHRQSLSRQSGVIAMPISGPKALF